MADNIKTILVIDDNEDLLATVQRRLETEGYEVHVLNEPQNAEKSIDECNPDLLIIDVFMPGRSGFDIVSDFKKNNVYQDIPKIFLTCLDDNIEKIAAKSIGVTEYITKPYEPEELLSVVREILGGKE